jgi:hypothetical protein
MKTRKQRGSTDRKSTEQKLIENENPIDRKTTNSVIIS